MTTLASVPAPTTPLPITPIMTTISTTTNNNNNTSTISTALPSITYEDALEDVHTRFILNLPDSELQTADRIFFQLEQAWWFYEDWICDARAGAATGTGAAVDGITPTSASSATAADAFDLPRFSSFKPFAIKLFEYSPLLPDISQFQSMWNEYTVYKRKISNYGCILLSADCTKFVLCRVWNGKSYTFPAGKINQGEDGMTAAARETYEETGFDPSCKFGITAAWKQQQQQQTQDGIASDANMPSLTTTNNKITWKPMQEKDVLVFTEENGKRRISYVVAGVPEDFPFSPVARKEVSSVAWYPIDDVPKPSYGVIPFLNPLRRWIKKYKKFNQPAAILTNNNNNNTDTNPAAAATTNTTNSRPSSKGRDGSNPRNNKRGSRNNTPRTTPNRNRTGSRGRVVQEDDALITAGLAEAGELSGWSEEEMFLVNEKLLGRRVEYDGNPHIFTDQGFGGQDPHAFRVVGGSFLNSGIQSLAPPPSRSILQPLFRPNTIVTTTTTTTTTANSATGENDDDSGCLTPFFSNDGVTPWGEVVQEACDAVIRSPERNPITTTTNKNHNNTNKKPFNKKTNKTKKEPPHNNKNKSTIQTPSRGPAGSDNKSAKTESDDDGGDDDGGLVLPTDAEITAKSQATKLSAVAEQYYDFQQEEEKARLQYTQDMELIQEWVTKLPKPRPTNYFGEFKLDVDKIMRAVRQDLHLPTSVA